jgi:hypothetical protein
METQNLVSETLPNGNTIHYQIVNGTAYHADTVSAVVNALEFAREHDLRITLDLGDVKTGKSWGEVNDISGYIGRSTGSIQIPLLLANARSHGGGAILDHCIIAIRHANKSKGGYLYRHPNYKAKG